MVSVPLSGLVSVNNVGSWNFRARKYGCFRPLIGVNFCKQIFCIFVKSVN